MVSTGVTTRRKENTHNSALRTMSFKTQPDMQRAIRIRAAELELDVSELIRRALHSYLEQA